METIVKNCDSNTAHVFYVLQILQALYCHLLQINHFTKNNQNLITWHSMQIRPSVKCGWNQLTGLYFSLLESLECFAEQLHGASNLEGMRWYSFYQSLVIWLNLCVVVRGRVLLLLQVSVSSRPDSILTNYKMCGTAFDPFSVLHELQLI